MFTSWRGTGDRGLPQNTAPFHLGSWAHDNHHLRRLLAGHPELSLALRAAAGAALSRLSCGDLARAARGGGARAVECGATPCSPRSLFVAGFSTVFVALGASAERDGASDPRLFQRTRDRRRNRHHRHGSALSGITPISWPDRQARIDVKAGRAVGRLCDGLAFALGWTPCIGPILAAILAVAASKATIAKGAGLLAVYVSRTWACRSSSRRWRSSRSPPSSPVFAPISAHMERVMGGLLVLTGVAFLTGVFTQLNSG